jgi:hypothetical protein
MSWLSAVAGSNYALTHTHFVLLAHLVLIDSSSCDVKQDLTRTTHVNEKFNGTEGGDFAFEEPWRDARLLEVSV